MILKEKIESIVNKYRAGFYVEAETLANNLIKKNIDDYQLINIYGLILVKLNFMNITNVNPKWSRDRAPEQLRMHPRKKLDPQGLPSSKITPKRPQTM